MRGCRRGNYVLQVCRITVSASGSMRCLYDVLGVEKDVDEATLKAAYKKAAFRWHPGENP